MTEADTTIVREKAKFIPEKMMRIQHIEHTYECKHCKMGATQKVQMKRGKAHKLPFSEALRDLPF